MKRALSERFSYDLAACLDDPAPRKIGVALSGGGDSTALLTLISDWGRAQDIPIAAATVDHGLRAGAADEAAAAKGYCRTLGVAHETLRWTGWQGKGNLQDAARRARIDLIGAWALAQNIDVVALGHTMDDQAETFLMRLSRGSGVDGLSAMGRHRWDDARKLRWIRPLLGWRRAELREVLRDRGVTWAQDPSNEDTRFERVRIRRALEDLPKIGLTVQGLAATAERLRGARVALEVATHELACRATQVNRAGDVSVDVDLLMGAPEDIRFRLLSHALKWVASAEYRPRQTALEAAFQAIKEGRRHSLAGCLVACAKDGRLEISREPKAVCDEIAAPGVLWDGRWSIKAPSGFGEYHVAALGEKGLKACPDWKSTGIARDSLLASPAAWRKDTLIVAFSVNSAQGWTCCLQKGADHLITSILSH